MTSELNLSPKRLPDAWHEPGRHRVREIEYESSVHLIGCTHSLITHRTTCYAQVVSFTEKEGT